MSKTIYELGLAFIAFLVIHIVFLSTNSSAQSLKSDQEGKTAVLFIPGIHHQYTGESGIFSWSENWKQKDIGSSKVDSEFAWKNALDQMESRKVDTFILFEKGRSTGRFVDGGILGHEVNEQMIRDSINELVAAGYTRIIIEGHSQAGANIFGALMYMSQKDMVKLNYIQSIRLFDPAFASPIGSLAAEPLVLPLAKFATGKLGTPLSPSEEDLTGRNGYLSNIRQSMPHLGKVLSQYKIPVYLMYADNEIVSKNEIKNRAQELAKSGCKVVLFSPQTGSLKFGDYKEGNKGYLYKKEASDPYNPKEQVPTESRMAHTPKLGNAENRIATNFYLYGISKTGNVGSQREKVTTMNNLSKKNDLAGVYIDPNLVENLSVEKGVVLMTLKEEVLGARPSKDSLYWDIKLPKGIE